MEDSFNVFLERVLNRTEEILQEQGINIDYISLNQKFGIPESWKCIKISKRHTIYYRIGRTKPRKGPHKGEDLLVIDLVMDGHKKKIFVPVLKKKDMLEKKLGTVLERELPNTEATGQYRLKLIMSSEAYYEGKVNYVARQLAHFIMETRPVLDELGVI